MPENMESNEATNETINNTPQDEWEMKLQEKTDLLKKCQESKNYTSCISCEKLLDCNIRDAYVQSVYQSMNKGQDGGFEF